MTANVVAPFMELVVTDVCMAANDIVVASFMRLDEAFVMLLRELDKSSNYKNRATTAIEQLQNWVRGVKTCI